MINKWSIVALFLMMASPTLLILVLPFTNTMLGLSLVAFFAVTTLIGIGLAISISRFFFLLRRIKKKLLKKPRKHKQKRCKICGAFKTYVVPIKRTNQKPIYICYRCSKKQ